jgi:spermidine synthase
VKNPATMPPPTAGLRQFLYLTAAITGAAILVVEILGAKMLSPFVGSSHFVWTAQIAVTLISLALGYYFGGWLVDRSPRLERLYTCIALAAIYLAITVLACRKVAYTFLELKLALGALLSSLFLFLVPLTLLAATGPFLIRVLAQSVEGIGGQVGRLSAISTFGSVLGTVLIGYVLLPFLRNSTTMFVTSGVLLALVVIYFMIWGRKTKTLVTATAIGAAMVASGPWLLDQVTPEFQHMRQLFFGNSNFGQLQVLEYKETRKRFYLNDYLIQNTYDPDQKSSLSLFTYMLHELAWSYGPGPLKNVLCIGMGVGIVPNALNAEGVQTDVVEINPAILPVAKKFFDFNDTGMNITFGDGRFFINKSQKHYDAIILDAFLGESSPSHLMTREAFGQMARLLGDDGVLVINSFGDFQPGHDFFVTSLDKTLRAVFKDVRIHTKDGGNIFFAASQRVLKLNWTPRIHFPEDSHLKNDVSLAMQESPAPNSANGIVLTDDYNPVDYYDAPNRERIRRNLALSLRDQ